MKRSAKKESTVMVTFTVPRAHLYCVAAALVNGADELHQESEKSKKIVPEISQYLEERAQSIMWAAKQTQKFLKGESQ